MMAYSKKVVPFCAAIALATAVGWAEVAKVAPKAGNAADAPAKARAKPRGRLPSHYGKVVDPAQKEKIYKIQQSYEPKIAELNAQLQALRDKRDAEIDAVLTAEQRQKVAQYQADAKKQRAAKAGAANTDDGAADEDTADEAGDDTDAPATDLPASDAPPAKAAPAKAK